ncbi:hypothetical protein OOU_Y34scaffold00542g39 [Pyricularia oryzae Y34]|uniref:Uncharacterized protein n=2 Tax=Pyricularia oryzae TaxID=318829 RepID=A0AA97PKV9_PYRO3|nr:hypothetical protein OOU_Y34scaffold00542g39 [Pyricularia oryzae Y34]
MLHPWSRYHIDQVSKAQCRLLRKFQRQGSRQENTVPCFNGATNSAPCLEKKNKNKKKRPVCDKRYSLNITKCSPARFR